VQHGASGCSEPGDALSDAGVEVLEFVEDLHRGVGAAAHALGDGFDDATFRQRLDRAVDAPFGDVPQLGGQLLDGEDGQRQQDRQDPVPARWAERSRQVSSYCSKARAVPRASRAAVSTQSARSVTIDSASPVRYAVRSEK
jgi:hypothetical protein